MSQLTPQLLVQAYAQGYFPMSHDHEILWHDPDPRAILPLDGLHVSRSLRRTLKRVRLGRGADAPYLLPEAMRRTTKSVLAVTHDVDFSAVIAACADPHRPGAWIDERILRAYTQLHQLGLAHSVEVWEDGRLVGGLYGVALGGLFAGEAMFSHVTDASKVALVYLVRHLQERGFQLLDVQFYTPHLGRLGVIEISREAYKRRLSQVLDVGARF